MRKILKFIREFVHHFWWHVLVYPVFAVISLLWGWAVGGKSWQQVAADVGASIVANPISISYPFVFVAVVSLCYKTVIFSRIRWLRLKTLEQMARDVGIHEFRHHNGSEKRENWARLASELKKSEGGQLSILGAGGYETFSSPDSPLHGLLKETNFDVRILLLDPDSEAFRQRCASINVSEEVYKDWIYASIEFCKYLKRSKNSSIEVRLYSDYPIWKMIFTPEYMWLQWYHPNADVHSMQVYLFQSTQGNVKTSLYYPLIKVFQRRWDLGRRIALDKWVRPK